MGKDLPAKRNKVGLILLLHYFSIIFCIKLWFIEDQLPRGEGHSSPDVEGRRRGAGGEEGAEVAGTE